jgi:hypothetical protein
VLKLASIIGRFPAHELAIRRICTSHPEFRGVCEDYDEAAAALLRWDAAGDQQRADEYRQITRDLEAEILQVLDAQAVGPPHRDVN